MNDTIVYQDNKSTILLEKNSRRSSSQRAKHINIRYFFVTERIEKKELSIKYCPTESMVSDYYTKPLQGGTFQKNEKYNHGI